MFFFVCRACLLCQFVTSHFMWHAIRLHCPVGFDQGTYFTNRMSSGHSQPTTVQPIACVPCSIPYPPPPDSVAMPPSRTTTTSPSKTWIPHTPGESAASSQLSLAAFVGQQYELRCVRLSSLYIGSPRIPDVIAALRRWAALRFVG